MIRASRAPPGSRSTSFPDTTDATGHSRPTPRTDDEDAETEAEDDAEDDAEDVRIIHVSIQRNHVHLLVEAAHKTALSRGMQGFQISAAKLMNAKIVVEGVRRRGQVFADRYHAEVIKTPKQARHTLAYVLNNWRKHRDDRGARERTWNVDPFSSGALFGGWKELEGRELMWELPEGYEALVVWTPRTWLLREGWRRYGLLRCREVPGGVPRAPRGAERPS